MVVHGMVKSVSPEQRAWDARLAAEGLGVVSWNQPVEARQGGGLHEAVRRKIAVERWTAWAERVRETASFRTERHRRVWELYAAGKRYGEIQAELRCRRRAISEAVAEVEASAPPKPCANPWRQDHRGARNGTRVRHLNGFQKRKQREERERESMEAKKPAPLVHYSRILLMRGHEVMIPGATRDKSTLFNVEGRIHAGGVEVMFITDKVSGERRPVVPHVTVPWIHMIQAERLPEVEG